MTHRQSRPASTVEITSFCPCRNDDSPNIGKKDSRSAGGSSGMGRVNVRLGNWAKKEQPPGFFSIIERPAGCANRSVFSPAGPLAARDFASILPIHPNLNHGR